MTAAKLKAASGLANLDNRRYKIAAKAFVEVSPELGTGYSDVSIISTCYMYSLARYTSFYGRWPTAIAFWQAVTG